MSSEARKLHLIEALLKLEDEKLLGEIETVLAKGSAQPPSTQKTFADFAGTLTDEEADEWLKNIEEGCEQINADDWK